MKGLFIGLIIGGGVVLVGGAALFAYGLSQNKIDNDFNTKEHEFEENIDNFDIKLSTANLEFKKAEDNKTKVVCVEKEKVYHTVEVKDNKLTIRQIDDRKWYQKYIFNINFKSMSVTVYLPEETYSDLLIDANTGKISIPNDFTFASVKASADTGDMTVNCKVTGNVELSEHTGDININDMNPTNITAKASTGKIRIKNCEVGEKISLKASTGEVLLENVTAKNYESKTSTGDVKLVNTVLENEMKIETSTGDVRFNKSDAKVIKVETDTGSVKGTLLTSKIFDAKSDTSTPKLPPLEQWDQTGGTCEIKTDTGAIDISIAK